MPDFHYFSIEQNDKCLKRGGKSSDTGSMKRYSVKCRPGKTEYIDILRELDDEYVVRFTRLYEGHEKITEETMSRHLFNICVKTGYLNQMTEPVCSVA
ncbi:MAG: hypothetical protein LBH44_10540 [Treponema sp.]|nr:hypothetical protein [Treponema sp.]